MVQDLQDPRWQARGEFDLEWGKADGEKGFGGDGGNGENGEEGCEIRMRGWDGQLESCKVEEKERPKTLIVTSTTNHQNVFAFSGEAKSKKYAVEIIHECHEAWRRLITGEAPNKTDSYELAM